MLFDLQSPGRRNAVKVIFGLLALLMALSVFVLSSGGGGGSVLDAFTNNSGGTSDSGIYKKKITQAEKVTTARPGDAAAWVNLAKVRYQSVAATQIDDTTGQVTKKGLTGFRAADAAWSRGLSLNPKSVDPTTANLMVQALGPAGLNENSKAVTAMEYVLNSRAPSVGLYTQYAELAYLAGQTRKGDLASSRAVDLAPKDDRDDVKSSLAQAKTQATQASSAAATGSGGASGIG